MTRSYEPELEDGDKLERRCKHCGDRYTHTVGQGGGRKLCPDCNEVFDDLDRVGSALRIKDDEERKRVRNLLKTEYGVWEHERHGELYIYRENE